MKLTKEYLAECEDCVFRNFNQIDGDRNSQRVQDRIKIIKDFCKWPRAGHLKILSVGCGAHEPIDINATHAVDVAQNAEAFLKKQGWKGEFRIGSCDDIFYPNKSFDVAVCSEVIEHLPDLDIVKRTFQEVARVAKRWIFTCPDWKGTEPTHKRAFTEKMLQNVTEGLDCGIKHIGRYWYVLHAGN